VLHLSRDRSAAAEARAFAQATLESWRADEAVLQDAIVVVSELVSNAVEHGGGDPVLELRRRGDRVVLRVSDDHPQPPQLRRLDRTATRGRGLLIVEAMVDRWGHEQDAGRKWVWAELSLTSPRSTADGSLV
jgi:two-component sensor histidine kinase